MDRARPIGYDLRIECFLSERDMSLLGQMLPDRLRYQAWCWKKYFSEAEIRAASRLARPGSRCIDVGANAGAYSYFMQRSGAKVEAFEPIPELADALKKRFNGSINIHQIAASNSDATTVIHAPLMNGQPQYGYASCENSWSEDSEIRIHVETRTIDSYDFHDVSLMKIDVEGYELAVLEGTTKTIERCKPALLIEAEERHRPNAVSSISSYLEQFGYQGKFIANGKEHPMAEFVQTRDQARPEMPGYICNFIFLA